MSLVGAGPGDPELMTLKGARRLREADAVYYDALAPRELLEWCRPEASLVAVGKRRGAASVRQSEIEAALVRDARAGLSVVRLKGGDPFVFGRGGEEALALLREGIPFELVPGVTSGTAAPALAGIPLTHRGVSSSAAFVTAHDLEESSGECAAAARLRHLALGAGTIVIFMAGAQLARVRRNLLEAGLAPDHPAALIESGTTPEERVAIGTVGGLEGLREELGEAGGPVLIVVGPTVSLSSQLRTAAHGRRRRNQWAIPATAS